MAPGHDCTISTHAEVARRLAKMKTDAEGKFKLGGQYGQGAISKKFANPAALDVEARETETREKFMTRAPGAITPSKKSSTPKGTPTSAGRISKSSNRGRVTTKNGNLRGLVVESDEEGYPDEESAAFEARRKTEKGHRKKVAV